jgi:hypothetical protein
MLMDIKLQSGKETSPNHRQYKPPQIKNLATINHQYKRLYGMALKGSSVFSGRIKLPHPTPLNAIPSLQNLETEVVCKNETEQQFEALQSENRTLQDKISQMKTEMKLKVSMHVVLMSPLS